MRRRCWCGMALGLISGLGGWGCATAPAPRLEAPKQFRLWNAPAGAASVPAKPDMFAPEPKTASAPRYRPGSLFFRRFLPPETPTTPPAMPDSKESLSRFFPGLYGNGQVDPARLARARRPNGGERPWFGSHMISAAAVETTRADLADSRSQLASEAESPILPVGLRVRAFPKVPSPGLPPAEALAGRDDPAPADRSERLVSNETPAPSRPDDPGAREPDPSDDLSTTLKPDAFPPSADAPSDPASRPTSATAETPVVDLPNVDETPRSDGARLIEPPPIVASAVESDVKPLSPARPRSAAPGRSQSSADDDPVLAGRPRMPRVEAMRLPDPEFPPTYHTESLQRVVKQDVAAPGSDRLARTPERRSLLQQLFSSRPAGKPETPKEHEIGTGDRAVTPSSGTGEPAGSVRPEPRRVAKRWKVFQGVPTHRVDEPPQR